MAEIQPFRGLRYNPEKIRLKDVITEPYDRIPPPLQEKYYLRNPYNVIRIILGKHDDPDFPGTDQYTRAHMYIESWLRENILIQEDKKALYLYEQDFRLNGMQRKRLGLIGRVKLEEFSSKKVLPHEKTFPKHKVDRLNLLRATNINTGQIFLLYNDDDSRISRSIEAALQKAEMGAEAQDEDNFLHRIWIIKDHDSIQQIQEALADKILIIADGHHRYETSLNYRREILDGGKEADGNEPFNYVMMTLFRIDDPGLVILPTYRMVRGLDELSEEGLKELLSPFFEISELEWSNIENTTVLEEAHKRVNSEDHVFAAYVAAFKKILIFRLKSEDLAEKEILGERSKEWKRLDVAILHSLIIDKFETLTTEAFSLENNVSYERNLEQGIQKINEREFQMIFLLKPVSLEQIRTVVENGELMPQKSTDFYPKLKSGLVMNPLDE